MTLLQRLQSALNKVYDGNTIASDEAKQDGFTFKDQYKCDCDAVVPEEEWVSEYKMCKDCYSEMMCDHGHKWGAR